MAPSRIASPADLEALRKELADGEKKVRSRVLICMTGCRALGAVAISKAFKEAIESAGLSTEVQAVDVGCHGLCAGAPLVLIEPQDYVYGRVKPEDVDDIVETTLRQGKPVPRLAVGGEGAPMEMATIPFYANQRKEVLRNCGRIDPRRFEDALARGAYTALAKALSMKPGEVGDLVKASGLRGRGGAGFTTGLKWEFARKAPGTEKYLICNADEGDPGAFMDRALLEGDPHRVIEGMIIAAWAIGASKGFMYVRAEYPIAVVHVNTAIARLRELGLLGENILGSGFSFDLEVRMGAGAFVCGEETALIASLEGKRGMPRPRPPFPAQRGFDDKPTNINNVETFANVHSIIEHGADWFRAMGTEGSKGTKIFALAGKVNLTGLVEVPMGITLRQIVYDVGGGIPNDRPFKAVQMGGPSGGCVPAEHLDLPLDYDSLNQVGAIMGSGGMIVMDDTTCMVDIARYFLEFTQDESCGKCVPCRVGTRQMLEILRRITRGEGMEGDIEALERLARGIKRGSLCGLGQTAPNPVLSTLRYFRDEYAEHILEGRCRAGVCKALLTYRITEACTGCGACKRACPEGAISGEKKEQHVIDTNLCIHCGACKSVCKHDAIEVA